MCAASMIPSLLEITLISHITERPGKGLLLQHPASVKLQVYAFDGLSMYTGPETTPQQGSLGPGRSDLETMEVEE